MKVFERLDKAFAKTPNPDEIASLIGDPFRKFIRMKDMTPELHARLMKYGPGFCFYNTASKKWDCDRSAESAPHHNFTTNSRTADDWMNFNEFIRYMENWAIIGWDHRLDPNLEFPS